MLRAGTDPRPAAPAQAGPSVRGEVTQLSHEAPLIAAWPWLCPPLALRRPSTLQLVALSPARGGPLRPAGFGEARRRWKPRPPFFHHKGLLRHSTAPAPGAPAFPWIFPGVARTRASVSRLEQQTPRSTPCHSPALLPPSLPSGAKRLKRIAFARASFLSCRPPWHRLDFPPTCSSQGHRNLRAVNPMVLSVTVCRHRGCLGRLPCQPPSAGPLRSLAAPSPFLLRSLRSGPPGIRHLSSFSTVSWWLGQPPGFSSSPVLCVPAGHLQPGRRPWTPLGAESLPTPPLGAGRGSNHLQLSMSARESTTSPPHPAPPRPPQAQFAVTLAFQCLWAPTPESSLIPPRSGPTPNSSTSHVSSTCYRNLATSRHSSVTTLARVTALLCLHHAGASRLVSQPSVPIGLAGSGPFMRVRP